MKKAHLVGVILIAVAIGAILSTISDSSTYASFSEAFSNPGSEFHVVGTYDRTQPAIYDPETNPDLFTFYMKDNNGKQQKVLLKKSKPQDFERSEQVVLIGKAEGNNFVASDILMKCPSKYNSESNPEAGQTAEL